MHTNWNFETSSWLISFLHVLKRNGKPYIIELINLNKIFIWKIQLTEPNKFFSQWNMLDGKLRLLTKNATNSSKAWVTCLGWKDFILTAKSEIIWFIPNNVSHSLNLKKWKTRVQIIAQVQQSEWHCLISERNLILVSICKVPSVPF